MMDVKNAPWDVIASLEADNSRRSKEAIILAEAEAGNDELFRGFKWALDAMITFGVRQVPTKTGDGRGLQSNTFWRIADELRTRRLTGQAAQNSIAMLRQNATEREWNDWYRRILIKDLRCGTTEKTINGVVDKTWPDYSVPVFSCQLAHDGANHEGKITGEKLIEIKLDGMRVISIVYPDGSVEQYSRNGKSLENFSEIRRQLAKHAIWFAEPTVLDGEVMSATFQDLMRQAHRKTDVDADDAVLHLFDIISLREFKEGRGQHRQIDRSFTLNTWYDSIRDHMPNVTVVGQEMVDLDTAAGQERFAEINRQAIAGGYEGIMIKDPSATYECRRTVSWLKQKPFIEVSLTVVDVEEGTGRNEGRLGALVCEGEDDGRSIQVNVGSGFSDALRDSVWNGRDTVVGHVVEVRADAVTQNQDGTYSLRFPRFKTFRGTKPGEKL
jgi:DNA ligase-1